MIMLIIRRKLSKAIQRQNDKSNKIEIKKQNKRDHCDRFIIVILNIILKQL